MGLDRVVRDIKSGRDLWVCAGRQELQRAQLGGGQRLGEPAAGPGAVRVYRAYLESCADELLGERILPQLGRMSGQVVRHLGGGGDHGAEEAPTARGVYCSGQDAGGYGVAALDRRGGQEYLPHQRLP